MWGEGGSVRDKWSIQPTCLSQGMIVTFCNVMELMMLDVAAVGSSNDD